MSLVLDPLPEARVFTPGSIQDSVLKMLDSTPEDQVLSNVLAHGVTSRSLVAMFLAWSYEGYHHLFTQSIKEILKPVLDPKDTELVTLISQVDDYLSASDVSWKMFTADTKDFDWSCWSKFDAALEEKISIALRNLIIALNGKADVPMQEYMLSGFLLRTIPWQSLSILGDGKQLAKPYVCTLNALNSELREKMKTLFAQIYCYSVEDVSDLARTATIMFGFTLPSGLERYNKDEMRRLGELCYLLTSQEGRGCLDRMLEDFSLITWDKMLDLQSLVEEYNWEWAMASFEWGDHG